MYQHNAVNRQEDGGSPVAICYMALMKEYEYGGARDEIVPRAESRSLSPQAMGKVLQRPTGKPVFFMRRSSPDPPIQGRSPAKCSCCYWYAVDDIHPICCEYRPLSSNGSRNRHGQAKRGPLLQQWK